VINRRSGLRVVICAAVLVVLDGMSSTASGAILTMNDVNSLFRVEPRDTANGGLDDRGAFSWQVDGTEHLFRQWFWYREDSTPMTHEESIDNDIALPFMSASLSNTDSDPGADRLRLRYQNSVFELVVVYNLIGGAIGSETSTIRETITIRNLTADPLSFHLFEYHDFNLNNTAADDSAAHLSPTTIQQTDPAGMQVTTTVTQSVPDHYEIAPVPTTYASLADLSATTLSDTAPALGPGDVGFAFQWDPIISPGGSFVIRLDQVISPGGPAGVVPEPGAMVLVGSGLAGLYWRRRARRA
jgi:hypothetical protein